MHRFGGVQEKRGGASGRQGGCDLAADMATFAHASDHQTTVAVQDGKHHLREILPQAIFQAQQRLSLDVEGLTGQLQGTFGVKNRGCGHDG